MQRYRTLLNLWLLSDLALFVGAYMAAYLCRVGWILSTDFPLDKHITVAAIIAPLWLIVLITTRTFSLTRNQATLHNAAYIIYAAVMGTALFTLTYYFLYGAFFSRLLLVYAMVFTILFTIVWHVLFEKILRSALRKDPAVFRALIIGVTRESKRLIQTLNDTKNPITPVAILDGRGTKEKEIAGVPVKGKLNKLEDVLQEDKITHLIQCSDLEQSLNLLGACRKQGITYMLLPSVLGIVERDERVESLEGQPVTMVAPKEGWWTWFFR